MKITNELAHFIYLIITACTCNSAEDLRLTIKSLSCLHDIVESYEKQRAKLQERAIPYEQKARHLVKAIEQFGKEVNDKGEPIKSEGSVEKLNKELDATVALISEIDDLAKELRGNEVDFKPSSEEKAAIKSVLVENVSNFFGPNPRLENIAGISDMRKYLEAIESM